MLSGRCSIISDLRVITFDGNNVALYDIGSYILVHLPREKIVGHIEKCPTSEVNPCYHSTVSTEEMYCLLYMLFTFY